MLTKTAIAAAILAIGAIVPSAVIAGPACGLSCGIGNGPSLNGVRLNGPLLQGIALNGIRLNGPVLQGVNFNGLSLNGPILQGVSQNGIRQNGDRAGAGVNGQVIAIEF